MLSLINPGGVYRHPGLLDVDMYVVRVLFRGPRYVRVKVKWFHRSLKTFIPTVNSIDHVKVRHKDLHKWHAV